jgi:heme exporter protein D
MNYDSFAWLPLAAGLTALGVVLSYIAWRRSGARPALRIAAWSLLPIAAYLTGAIEMLWKIGAAIGKFGTAFVFSPTKWAGIAVAGLALVLLVATGNKARRRAAREQRKAARAERRSAAGPAAAAPGVTAASTGTAVLPAARTPAPAPAKTPSKAPAKGSGRAASSPGDDDDLKDIEEILRQRGI